jgi:phosphoserine aminotransferase
MNNSHKVAGTVLPQSANLPLNFLPLSKQVHNFNSGPSVLPKLVYQQAAEAIYNFNETGLSILEIGHRTPHFVAVIEEAQSLVKELLRLPAHYQVLFLHGGATTQFMQVPMNLLNHGETAAYTNAGIWGSKAIKEATLFGEVHIAGSSANNQYRHIPQNLTLPPHCKYLHVTSNNTVEGTQIHTYPEVDIPLIADMSSDIFSREMDYSRFSLIYAGAQKNMGAAGVNLLVIDPHILGITRPIPAIMDYQKHIEANSLLNTPPVFAIYVALLTLRWIKSEGGLAVMEQKSLQKSNLLYNTIDQLPLFNCPIAPADRSRMNAVFFIENEVLQNRFLELCKQENFIGIKGYRTMGGLRVSMYNALEMGSVQLLCDMMHQFAQQHG